MFIGQLSPAFKTNERVNFESTRQKTTYNCLKDRQRRPVKICEPRSNKSNGNSNNTNNQSHQEKRTNGTNTKTPPTLWPFVSRQICQPTIARQGSQT